LRIDFIGVVANKGVPARRGISNSIENQQHPFSRFGAAVDTLPDLHNVETGKKSMQYVIIGIFIMVASLYIANFVGIVHAH